MNEKKIKGQKKEKMDIKQIKGVRIAPIPQQSGGADDPAGDLSGARIAVWSESIDL